MRLEKPIFALVFMWFAVVISIIPAWVTHVIVCIKQEMWLFLIAGAIAAPVGVIHGWGVWFGWWS